MEWADGYVHPDYIKIKGAMFGGICRELSIFDVYRKFDHFT